MKNPISSEYTELHEIDGSEKKSGASGAFDDFVIENVDEIVRLLTEVSGISLLY